MTQQGHEPEVTDLTRGVYRRIYAAFIKGKRINEVTLDAEAWFWRIQAVADDFGNADGDPRLCRDATAGYREVTTGQVAKWIDQLVNARLLLRYDSNGDAYIHIPGFLAWQPAGKNGKRVRRYPQSPWENIPMSREGPLIAPGESGGIQIDRCQSSASHSDTHSDTDTEINTSTEPPAAAVVVPVDLSFPTFPTIGRGNQAKTWRLTDQHLAELAETFPGVNVPMECRKAHGWIKASPSRRKTAGGMSKFLFGWMERNQNRLTPAYGRGGDGPKTVLPSDEWKKQPYSAG